MYWTYHYWGMHLFWWIFWVFLVGALLFWVWQGSTSRHDSAVDELRRTYAAGQLTEEEYRHRLAVLREVEPRHPSRPRRPSRPSGLTRHDEPSTPASPASA
jgi:putative membrane protein